MTGKKMTDEELKKQESPKYKVRENDDGYVEITFRLPRRFYEWLQVRARIDGLEEGKFIERLVRQTWATCPIRRSSGGSMPASMFKA